MSAVTEPDTVPEKAPPSVAQQMRGGAFTLLGLLALVPLVCLPTSSALAALWLDAATTTYLHGFLLLGVSIWLIWRSSSQRPTLVLDLQPAAAVLLLLTGIGWAWAVQSGIGILAILMMLMIAALAALTFFGREGSARCTFALLLLVFATPIWGSFNPLLQWLTVYVVQFALLIANIPVQFESNQIHLASGSFEIAGGCSGLHFLISALAIAALLGELNDDTLRRRIKLMALAAVMALMMNWIRVFAIVMIGQYTQMQHYIVAKSHYGFGWALFALMMVLYFSIERRIPWQRPANEGAAVRRPDLLDWFFPAQAATGRARTSALVAAFLALLLPGLMRVLAARPVEASTALPVVAEGWQMVPLSEVEPWQPRFDGVDAHQIARFVRDRGPFVELYAAAWGHMDPTRKFGGYYNSPMPDSTLVDADPVVLSGWPAHRLHLRDAKGREWVLLVGYDVAGRPFDSALQAQMWYGLSSLAYQHSLLSRVLVLRSPCRPDCQQAQYALAKFHAATGGAY